MHRMHHGSWRHAAPTVMHTGLPLSSHGRFQCELSNEVRQVVWYVDFAWKMPLNGTQIFRGCAPDPLTPGQVRGVPEGGCRADVW